MDSVTNNVIGPTDGITTAIIVFIFAGLIFPERIKNRTQYFIAFVSVLVIILLHSLGLMIGATAFQLFAGALTGVLQIVAIVSLYLSVGGMRVKELMHDVGNAYEVIRRGEETKEVIIPLSGQKPAEPTADQWGKDKPPTGP